MAQLYLVAFKEHSDGSEGDINYALREVIEEHCSYCLPAGKTEVYGPYTPGKKLAEICWLMQEVGFEESDYWDLIDELRSRYERKYGQKSPSWHESFPSREKEKTIRNEDEARRNLWTESGNRIFRLLIKKWIPMPKRS